MAKRDKIEILLDNGQEAFALAPYIISASRSTDVPAFYADWFLNRLQVGYSAWTNPFNGVKSYVSYSNTRFIVFWSKNPRPLITSGLLDFLEKKDIKCYIQYTLNDYEEEGLEKGVPPIEYRIETFKMLSERLGKDSIIWRFDPLILTDTIDSDKLLSKIQNIGAVLKTYTNKLVFSFADIIEYGKVKRNLDVNGVKYRIWSIPEMDDFAKMLSELNKEEGWNLELATCGEKIDIDKYGIRHNRCIDGDLITKLAWKDSALMKSMGINVHEIENHLFKMPLPEGAVLLDETHYFISNHKKDPGQRALCGCMAAKDIGEYNTCPHLCEYCYANTSKEVAQKNYNLHRNNQHSDSITGR